MKKILGISLVAVFAVAPLMARAEGLASEPTHAATASSGNTTTAAPQYQVASADANTDGNLATAGYVKGAYNAAIRGINKVAADAVQTANLADKSLTIDAASVKINGADALTSAALDGYATEAYAKNGANLTAGTVAKTALAAGVQSSLDLADSALQADSALNGANLTAGTVAKTALDTTVQASLDKADTALQSADIANKADKATTLAGYGIGDAYTKTQVDSAISSSASTTLQSAQDYAKNGANLTAGTVAKTALDTTVQASLGKADTALQADSALNGANLNTASVAKTALAAGVQSSLDLADSALQSGADLGEASVAETALATAVQTALASARTALQTTDIANMATQNGVLATINSATVPVMTTWGSTAVDSTSFHVVAPAAYVPGQGE